MKKYLNVMITCKQIINLVSITINPLPPSPHPVWTGPSSRRAPAPAPPAPPRSLRRWSHACWSWSRTRPTGGSWPTPRPWPTSARTRPSDRKSSTVGRERRGGIGVWSEPTNSGIESQNRVLCSGCFHCVCYSPSVALYLFIMSSYNAHRVVRDGARPHPHADGAADGLLQAPGEAGDPPQRRAGHHLPQPG